MIEIAPGIKRIKKFNAKRNSITKTKEIKMVKEYFNHGIAPAVLKEKYDIPIGYFWKIINTYEAKKVDFGKPPEAYPPIVKEQLLIVKEKDIEFIAFLLSEYNCEYRVPESYEYQEAIESKINSPGTITNL